MTTQVIGCYLAHFVAVLLYGILKATTLHVHKKSLLNAHNVEYKEPMQY